MRERLLQLGGLVEAEQEASLIGHIPIHCVMGKGYLFGTWYGRVPARLRILAAPGNADGSTLLTINCDLAAIENRFLWVFFILGAVVMLAIVGRGWRDDPTILFVLPFPYLICWGNFLSLRIILLGKMRDALNLPGTWWDK
jgi:hypothetical protein